jgi:hypothetical protein
VHFQTPFKFEKFARRNGASQILNRQRLEIELLRQTVVTARRKIVE